MTFTFVSNYINHHQLPVARRMFDALGEDYVFIQTEPMEAERIAMGWGNDGEIPFLHLYYEEEEYCKKRILESDIVMFGGVEDESFIEPRLQAGKPVIRYAERFYKSGRYKAVSPRGLRKKYHDHTRYQKYPVYLLCAGAYVAGDYAIVRAYKQKRFTWGYFPAFLPAEEADISAKQIVSADTPIELLWAGRMIDWKHPEMVIELARELSVCAANGSVPAFHITMVGGGTMESELKQLVEQYSLTDYITFTGFQKPDVVRKYMDRAQIHLFTSDRGEGWGAVMNEAMNSGCCVIADRNIGAAPSLIQSGENGILYHTGKTAEFTEAVCSLLNRPDLRNRMAINAYRTIAQKWNPEYAADELLKFSEAILKEYAEKGPGGTYGAPLYYKPSVEGPLSIAKLM